MSFGIDYSQASSGELPEGEYEAIIKYAGEDVTPVNKTAYINVTLVVRNDVDQPQKDCSIRHSIWHKKQPSPADLACGGYSAKQIQSLSKAIGLPDGKRYENLEDWCEDLGGKLTRITVKHEEYPEGSGKKHARVRWLNETKHPDCQHVWKSGTEDSKTENFQEIKNTSDDDLPF